MSSDQDQFLLDLRKELIQELETTYNELTSELTQSLLDEPVATLDKLLAAFHNLKGNAHAVGYPHLCRFVHEFESAIESIRDFVANPPGGHTPDLGGIEFFVYDALGSLSLYSNFLCRDLEDKESNFTEAMVSVAPLKQLGAPSSSASQKSTGESRSEEGAEMPELNSGSTSNEVTVKAAEPQEEVVGDLPGPSDKDKNKDKDKDKDKDKNQDQQLSGPKDYLFCQMSGQDYAVPIQVVVEVLKWRELSSLPHPRKGVMGVLVHFGQVVPVLDLFPFEPPVSSSQKYKFIVIGQHKDVNFGFGVDSVDQVRRLEITALKPLDRNSEEGRSFISHIFLYESNPVMILDIGGIAA